jgi:lysophospholipase L1-like esterase
MSAPDRSWSIAPIFLWFGAFLWVGLFVFDGGVSALADRLTSRRNPDAPATPGPVFTPAPVVVADVDPTNDKPPPPLADKGDRGSVGALEDVCVDGAPPACKRWGMDGYYRSVAQSKKAKLGRAVRVSWYGDSVIATDAIPGHLRVRLQAELGDGGPGFVYPVPPHRFCAHEAITRSSSGGWISYAISTNTIADGLYGPGGASAEVYGGKSTIKLVAGSATNVELYYLSQPRGGSVSIMADGAAEVVRADTKADAKQPGYVAGTVAGGAKKLEISAEGKVRLFGVDLENTSGVVVDNLGIVSVNVKSFRANNAPHFANELSHRNADLVMIMIGANEAQWLGPGDKDTKEYQANYEAALKPIRAARPDGSCLVVSPTDQAEAKDGRYPSRPVMPILVEAQRKAAHAQGCAFYSTYEWMGGKGSASSWYRKGLVGSDFQHLSRKGANKLADALYDALAAGFKRYAGN